MKKNLVIKLRGKILFHWVLIARSNGQVLGTSEVYFSKSNAIRAAEELSKAIKVPFEK